MLSKSFGPYEGQDLEFKAMRLYHVLLPGRDCNFVI